MKNTDNQAKKIKKMKLSTVALDLRQTVRLEFVESPSYLHKQTLNEKIFLYLNM